MGEETREGVPLKERYHDVLVEVAEGIEKVLVDKGVELGEGENRGRIEVDKLHLDVVNRGSQPIRFYFWGGLVAANFLPGQPVSKDPVPTVKNIRIPENLRRGGLATRIIDVWEEIFRRHGFRVFAATNTQGEGGRLFWESRGYRIPPSEVGKEGPYYMIKEE